MRIKKELFFSKGFIIFTLILSLLIIGGTYSYFAFTYENDSTIVGNVIGMDMSLDVELIVGDNSGMVPLKDSALNSAINGTGGVSACVDANSNLSCQVYKITLTNNGSPIKNLKGTIELYAKSGGTYTDLKWRELTNPTTVKEGSIVNGMESSLLAKIDKIEHNEVLTYYIAVYIQETDVDQRNSNKGDFGGTVTFETYDSSLLSNVEPGSYVAYTGNNGCSGNACSGQNANYVSDTDMGYCWDSSYKFTVNGWRVGYISDGTAYLVSAGAPTCLCTNSDGTVDTSGSDCSSNEETNGAPLHIANLNNEALKYCNSNYAYGGVCNSSSAWSMQNDDFNQITGSTLSTCFDGDSSTDCGLNNTLIDNGGFYWYATQYSDSTYQGVSLSDTPLSVSLLSVEPMLNIGSALNSVFSWYPDYRRVYSRYSSDSYGVRPVLRLQSSVQVTGGSGTYEDPYQISNG